MRYALPIAAVVTLAISGSLPLGAQAPASQVARSSTATTPLPVRRIVLYKSGVGFFEHLGRVRGSQNVTIEFTSGQLDDVLKSLTTLDLDGGRVLGVSYNSEDSLNRRLGALRLPVGEATTRAQFLSALRGARLEVRSGASVASGRLLSVEQTQRATGGAVAAVDVIALVNDAGDIQTVALDPGVTVRVMEADLNQEVGRYLSLVASARDEDVRRLTIATAGAGDRNLYVSYVSEVPVWKATYRLVMPTAATPRKPLLQGWAIIDNTAGQDWDQVELSLVAGAPQSFIQQISRPYYVQRPVVALPSAALLAPQTHDSALTVSSATPGADSSAGGTAQLKFATAPPPPAPISAPRGGGGGRGGLAAGASGGFAGARPQTDLLEEVRAAQQADATGGQLGDLFEYKLKEPVTIRKNQSALVPILSGDVEAEKVSLWNASSPSGRPLRAVWLTNATGLTLDGGSFSVIDGDAFAGEGLMDSFKPQQKRLLSYAIDLGVMVDAKGENAPVKSTRVQISRGLLIQHTEERQTRTYTARNDDTDARVLVIEHPVRTGWTLSGTVKPVESTASVHRFRLTIAPKTTVTLAVEETRPGQTQFSISAITDNQIALLVRDSVIPASVEAQLRQVMSQKATIARLNAEMTSRQSEIDQIGRDQERVRENMKSLKGSNEEKQLLQRYVKQLDDQETRLAILRKELEGVTADRNKAQDALNKFIEGLG